MIKTKTIAAICYAAASAFGTASAWIGGGADAGLATASAFLLFAAMVLSVAAAGV